jgi:hypothetical protein
MKLKDEVEQILRDNPKARDSDIRLTLFVWIKFYMRYIRKDTDGDYCIKLKELYDLPREDHIKRIRAKFNEIGLYRTTDKEVAAKRRQKEIEWRKELGYVR